jgi:hypothetical protein
MLYPGAGYPGEYFPPLGPHVSGPASVHAVSFSATGPHANGLADRGPRVSSLSSRGPHATDLESV